MIKPILFNTEMVKAIMDGRKTVTRRPVKPSLKAAHCFLGSEDGGYTFDFMCGEYNGSVFVDWVDSIVSPFVRGDILWVRETWARDPFGNGYIYPTETVRTGQKWSPSIHMPKKAARLFLRVTEVRVERLQDMTEEDAFAEGYEDKVWCEHPVYENYPDSPIPCYAAGNPGCPPDPPCNHSIPELFGSEIWDSTIKPADRPLYGCEANPWVWVIDFERCDKPEGFV